MKLKNIIALMAIAGLLGLAGCKPKETTITGQVVISDKIKAVTQARLEARQRDITNAESLVQTCQINVSNEEQNVKDAQKQFATVKNEYDQFMATQPLLTNAVYVKIKKDLAFRTGLIPSQQQTIQSLKDEIIQTSRPGQRVWVQTSPGKGYWSNPDETARIALNQADKIYLVNAKNVLTNTYAQIKADQRALEKLEYGVDEFQANKLHAAESLLNTAKSRLTQAQSKLDTAKTHLETIKNVITIWQGDVQISIIKSIAFKYKEVTAGPEGLVETRPARLTITVNVQNLSSTKKIDFRTWHGSGFSVDRDNATLTDNYQNEYKMFQDTTTPESHPIYPGDWFQEDLNFEPPVNNIQWLHLELPAKNFGGDGMIRFEIPASGITFH